MDSIKRSELLHFSHVASRSDVLLLDTDKRAELIESAMTLLYRLANKEDRDELLSLVQTIMRADLNVSQSFKKTSYVVCSRHMVITFANDQFLVRSGVEAREIIGKSLYYEREYEGTQIEQLYSMVMETRLLADALVRYDMVTIGGTRYNGWFVIVVVPLEDGGIGVLSRFATKKSEVVADIDLTQPDAPRLIVMSAGPPEPGPDAGD